MPIAHTRAMIRAALGGALDAVEHTTDPIFNLAVPADVPNVPREVLMPRATWANAVDYDMQARRLADMFVANFASFEAGVSEAVKAAGPRAT
jgi:phosphoenolpyruvate carboxykinase (ATP)